MHVLTNPQYLKYNITPDEQGVLLYIWEPAPVNQTRTKPYLFIARHRLESNGDALELLNYYRSVYQATG